MRQLGALAALVRLRLAAARSRVLSSDVILASQQAAAQKEEELNQLVHLVNNVSQDVSARCDELRGRLRTLVAAGPGAADELSGQVGRLEDLLRSLAAGVSDVKLLKELIRQRSIERRDQVPVSTIVEELEVHGRFRSGRGGGRFTCIVDCSPDTRVAVASREFLETALRAALRLLEERGSRSLKLRIHGGTESVIFDLTGDAPALEPELLRQAEAQADFVGLEEGVNVVRGLLSLARLSGGTFEFVSGGAAALRLALPAALLQGEASVVAGQWALVVDDNPQVTSFYARAAEALNLRYFAAVSCAEAERIVALNGRPRLVITDIRLGDRSGLELVRSLRRQYDSELPIIVVSGDTGATIAAETAAAGASCYLAKPISRSKLLAEIRSLLPGQPLP